MATDTFLKLKSTVNRGITTISVKTSSSLEKSKIKLHIETLEKEIQATFLSIGEDAYAIWESQSSDFQPLSDKFCVIKQKKSEVEQLNNELNAIDIRDNQILGATYQEVAQAQTSISKIVCPNCGSEYNNPAKFCRKCGFNLQSD